MLLASVYLFIYFFLPKKNKYVVSQQENVIGDNARVGKENVVHMVKVVHILVKLSEQIKIPFSLVCPRPGKLTFVINETNNEHCQSWSITILYAPYCSLTSA